MRTLMVGALKGRLLGAIATGLLALPGTTQAAVVTVWDTFDGTPIEFGMQVGFGIFQGVKFVPSASGFFVGFTFGAWQMAGTDDWVFTLHSDSSGSPGSVLETTPSIDVAPISGTNPPGVYNGTASGATFLTAGNSYWLMAQLPSSAAGGWSQIETGIGTRAFCFTGPTCSSFTVSNDDSAGAFEVRVQTSPVPLPAAAWLLLSGLAGFGFMTRRRTAA